MWPIQTKCKAFPSPQTPGFELPSWHAALDANLHVPLYGTQFPSTHWNWFLAEQPRPAKKRKCCPILVCNFSITCVGISGTYALRRSYLVSRIYPFSGQGPTGFSLNSSYLRYQPAETRKAPCVYLRGSFGGLLVSFSWNDPEKVILKALQVVVPHTLFMQRDAAR